MGNFFTDVISKSSKFKSKDIVSDLALLEPNARALVQAIIADAGANGLKLMVFETYRSKERQELLFAQGATKLKNVGVHHYGLACDIVKDVNGHPSWKGDFSLLGHLAHHHSLIWGGDWGTPGIKHTFLDDDHVQRCSVGRQASLFAGSWYPDDKYNPYADL
jgi:D-alanyl-D-alanine carboxypeptidase